MKIYKWLIYAKNFLYSSETALLDAELLIRFYLNCSRIQLFCWYEKILFVKQIKELKILLFRRFFGEPISYIIGKKEFWSMDFSVSYNTLIPRPETEILVEEVLLKISKNFYKILDLGSGSGAISLSIASEKSCCFITGVDICQKSLKIAQKNKKINKITNVVFLYSNWFSEITNKKFNIIVSNPPYLSEKDFYFSSLKELLYEPYFSLISGKTGLEHLKYIIENSYKHFYKNGWLFLEHSHRQSKFVRFFFKKNNFINIFTKKDYNGSNRITFGQIQF